MGSSTFWIYSHLPRNSRGWRQGHETAPVRHFQNRLNRTMLLLKSIINDNSSFTVKSNLEINKIAKNQKVSGWKKELVQERKNVNSIQWKTTRANGEFQIISVCCHPVDGSKLSNSQYHTSISSFNSIFSSLKKLLTKFFTIRKYIHHQSKVLHSLANQNLLTWLALMMTI